LDRNYVAASAFRFMNKDMKPEVIVAAHRRILSGDCIHIPETNSQQSMLNLSTAD
jgi:hypothetical protein